MKLHRLRLDNVKGVHHRDVTFPDSGVIVVEGPNEIGKTSMVEAFDMLIEEKDSSKKRSVLAMRPVGSDVATAVEVELSTGRYRLRYRKQWFRQPSTELHILSPRVEHLVGVAAHDRVRAILAETTDLVLWKALRLMQATSLDQVDLSGSSALPKALDAASGSTGDAGQAGETLVAAAESEYLRYFTAGKGVPCGEHRLAMERVLAASAREEQAEAALAEAADDVRRHAELAGELEQAQVGAEEARGARDTAQTDWDRVAALLDRRVVAERESATAGRDLTRAVERLTERRRQIDDVLAREGQASACEQAAKDSDVDVAPLTAQLEVARQAQADLDDVIGRLTAEVGAAERQEAASRSRAELANLRMLMMRARAAEEDRCAADEILAGLPAVDDQILRELQRLAAARDVAAARVESESAQLTVQGLSEHSGVLVDGVEITLGADGSITRSLSEALDVEVPGSVLLRWRPEVGAQRRAAELAAATSAVAEALACAGVADLDAAREAHERRSAALARRAHAQQRLHDLLGGQSMAEMAVRLDHLRAVCAESTGADVTVGSPGDALRGEPTGDASWDEPMGETDALFPWPGSGDGQPVAGSMADVEDARACALVARQALDAARAERDALLAQMEIVRSAVERATTKRASAQTMLSVVHTELESARARLEAARSAEPDEALADELARAQEGARAADGTLRDLKDAIAALQAPQLRASLDAAEQTLTEAEARLSRLRMERVALEARLDQIGRQGRHEQWEAACAQRHQAEGALAAIRRRAEAARLLHETLQEHRSRAKAAYVEPYSNAIRRLGQVVWGDDFAVEVDESLTVQARIMQGQRIDYDALSTGAKEQLAIISRLACASIVDPDQGVPVIIDDALGSSDPQRISRISSAFSLLGAGTQVVLLTCTPGRYAGIGGAHVIHLESA